MKDRVVSSSIVPAPLLIPPARTRRGAIGKALLVWLLSGSLGVAVVAFLIFSMMGC